MLVKGDPVVKDENAYISDGTSATVPRELEILSEIITLNKNKKENVIWLL